MSYTVKKLSQLSGVSVRTLHFYDEIGLLKPARVDPENGYRYYEEAELLLLQQILFFRELGFELKKIQSILHPSEPGPGKTFDVAHALKTHRRALVHKRDRLRTLIETVDKTLERLQGERQMKDEEMYYGFTPEQQKEYEDYLKNRLGGDHPAFAQSRQNTRTWKKEDWEKSGKEWDAICRDLSRQKENGLAPDSPEVQKIITRHYEWIQKFWTPNRESYTGLGAGYTEFAWKKAFDPYDPDHPKLALYLAEAMRVFADRELDSE